MMLHHDILIDNLIYLWSGRSINELNEKGETPFLEFLHWWKDESKAILCLAHSQFDPFQVTHDGEGFTALSRCAYNGFEDCAKVLLVRGADVNQTEIGIYQGWTALHNACYRKDPCMVALLLEHGADVSTRCRQYQALPIHEAAEKADAGIVSMLLQAGSPVNDQNVHGNTPLHLASRGGGLPVVKVLVEHGADRSIVNTYGKTPPEMCWYGSDASRFFQQLRRR